MNTGGYVFWIYVFWIYVFCLIDSVLSSRSAYYCINEVARDPGFQECLGNYTIKRDHVLSSTQFTSKDPILILTCSSETRLTVQCLTFFIDHCPGILNATQLSEYDEVRSLQIFDDLDEHCRTELGACHDVERCLSKIITPASSPYTFNPTPFSLMQEGVQTLCGPLKRSLNCFNGRLDQCGSYIRENKILWNNTLPSFLTIVISKSLDNFTLHFIINECHKLPADFSTNNCVKTRVSSDGFVQCYEKVLVTYPPGKPDNSCKAYNAGYTCIAKFVGNQCGHEYTEALAVTSPLFISDVPKHCKPIKPLAVSGNELGTDDTSESDIGVAGIIPSSELYPRGSSTKPCFDLFRLYNVFCLLIFIFIDNK